MYRLDKKFVSFTFLKSSFNIFLLLGFVLLCSCSEKSKKENIADALFDKVMKVHDEAMEQMPILYKNRKFIKDSLINVDSAFIKEHIFLIDSADEAMGKWMSEFNGSFQTMPQAEQEKYLNNELEKATAMSKLIEEAIAKSNDVVANGKLPNRR
jgi:hypothetical protein